MLAGPHEPVYRRRADVNCVLHTHMPYATALCMPDKGRLDMALQTSTLFHDRIAYDDDYPASVAAAGRSEGERLADALGDRDVLFMRSHGILVCGRSVGAAMYDIYYLEKVCRMQWLAAAYGGASAFIPEEALERHLHEPFRLLGEHQRGEHDRPHRDHALESTLRHES